MHFIEYVFMGMNKDVFIFVQYIVQCVNIRLNVFDTYFSPFFEL